MNYNEFKRTVSDRPLIFSRDIAIHKADRQAMLNQLNRWQAKRLLIKLKRGVFLLNEDDRKITPSRGFIANQLYSPSYVSLEYALNYYGIIPERVSALTSISTRKTSRISNTLGEFIYQHLKPYAFRGFKAVKDEAGLSFFIAEPEKAIVDFCYLHLKSFEGDCKSVFRESYRFQNLNGINAKKVKGFTEIFNNKKLARVSECLCGLIREER